jgi:hypothetical protein
MELKMGTPLDYQTGSTAAAACMKATIESMVAEGTIPEFAESQAEGFVAKMAPSVAKAVIDALDAERSKGTAT